MAGICKSFAFACRAERLTRATSGPDRFVIRPSGAAQGVIGIEVRQNDTVTKKWLSVLNHYETTLIVTAERAALQTLDGSCRTPVGAYATRSGDRMHLKVEVASPDGQDRYEDEIEGAVMNATDAERLGQIVGLRLKARVPADLLTDE